MKEYLTMKEFSTLSGVSQSTLRYWDDTGLFSPMRRNPENNYRYYHAAQLIPLNFVTTLSELNIPRETIASLKNNRNPDAFIEVIDHQEKIINEELRRLRTCYSIIHTRRELISFGAKNGEAQIGVVHREETTFSLGPRNEYAEGENFIQALAPLVRESRGLHINLSFPVGGYYDDFDSFINEPTRPNHFFTIDPIGTHTSEDGDYLVCIDRGYYGDFGDIPQRMAVYAEENSIFTTGPFYVIYLQDGMCIQNPDDYLVQCYVAVSKRKRPSK